MNFLSLLSGFGVTWNTTFEASPIASTDKVNSGPTNFHNVATAVRERLTHEHVMTYLTDGSVASDGWHKPGAAIGYTGTTAPTTRPDGSTAFTQAIDTGRIYFDTNGNVPVIKVLLGVSPTWTRISGLIQTTTLDPVSPVDGEMWYRTNV